MNSNTKVCPAVWGITWPLLKIKLYILAWGEEPQTLYWFYLISSQWKNLRIKLRVLTSNLVYGNTSGQLFITVHYKTSEKQSITAKSCKKLQRFIKQLLKCNISIIPVYPKVDRFRLFTLFYYPVNHTHIFFIPSTFTTLSLLPCVVFLSVIICSFFLPLPGLVDPRVQGLWLT